MTRFLLTLDYELFFGARHGTVERCMISPTKALANCVEKHGQRLTLFVDACYLMRARDEAKRHKSVERDFMAVAKQLSDLSARGHDVQLHIHPHWQDTYFDGSQWNTDTTRYRLNDFSQADVNEIVAGGAEILEDVKQDSVFAYRAGGWCIQPPGKILNALKAVGIWLDSTVYHGGFSEVENREYDFRDAPDLATWRFNNDPVKPDSEGYFFEVPISSCRYQTSAFWQLVLKKLHTARGDHSYGDGGVMPASMAYYLRRLMSPTWSPVSIDSVKAQLLSRIFRQTQTNSSSEIFNVMGHPKSVTPNGIDNLGEFLQSTGAELESATLRDFSAFAPVE